MPSPAPRSATVSGGSSLNKGLGPALPGAAGNVFASEAASHFVEKGAGLVLALAQRELERSLIVTGFGNLGGGLLRAAPAGQLDSPA